MQFVHTETLYLDLYQIHISIALFCWNTPDDISSCITHIRTDRQMTIILTNHNNDFIEFIKYRKTKFQRKVLNDLDYSKGHFK